MPWPFALQRRDIWLEALRNLWKPPCDQSRFATMAPHDAPSAWDQTMKHGMSTKASPAARNKVAPPGPGQYEQILKFPDHEKYSMVPLRPETWQLRREQNAWKETYLPERKQVATQAPQWTFKKSPRYNATTDGFFTTNVDGLGIGRTLYPGPGMYENDKREEDATKERAPRLGHQKKKRFGDVPHRDHIGCTTSYNRGTPGPGAYETDRLMRTGRYTFSQSAPKHTMGTRKPFEIAKTSI